MSTPLLMLVISAATPAIDLNTPLTVEVVTALALEHRDELTAARARARAAAERPEIVSALEDPMISPSIDHLPFALHGADFGVTVEQRFPISRVRAHRELRAKADLRRIAADTERVGLDLQLEAAQAFWMLFERREMAKVAEAQLQLAQQMEAAAKARIAVDSSMPADVLRAEIELARMQAMLRAARHEIKAAEAMLNVSIGRDAGAPVPPLEAPSRDTVAQQPSEAVATARARRPELRAGRAEIDRAEAEIAEMGSMYWPMGMIRTGPASTMQDGAGWMLMIGISIPLQRGRLDAGARESEAMADMARADLRAMERMIEGDVARAVHETAAARERYLALENELLPRARSAIEPTLAGYAGGTLPLVSVIETAEALWSIEAEVIEAKAALGIARAKLGRALGSEP